MMLRFSARNEKIPPDAIQEGFLLESFVSFRWLLFDLKCMYHVLEFCNFIHHLCFKDS